MSLLLAPEPPLAAYAVSRAQRRLWVEAETNPHSVEYSLPGGLRLEGPLDKEALRAALQALVDRHESLRTRFDLRNGQVCQWIDPQARVALEETDLRHKADPETVAQGLADAEALQPFDLRRGPLLRTRLLTLAKGCHVLLYNLHHIITDEASNAVLIRELGLLYEAFVTRLPDPLPPLELQYKDFAAWQNERLAGPEAERARLYWRGQFATVPPPLGLSPDFPRPPRRTSAGASVAELWEPNLLDRITSAARRHRATLFQFLAALVRVHLFRSTGQADFVLGAPASNRDESELEDQIGFYVNTLALRQALRAGDSFATVLGREREAVVAAFDHALYPFDQLVDDLRLPPDPGRTPLFQTLVHLQDATEAGPELSNLRLTDFAPARPAAKTDLAYQFTASTAGLHCSLLYSTELFRAERAGAMLGQLRRLAEAVLAAPERRIDQLEMLSTVERRQVIQEFNNTAFPWPEATAVDLFEAWAGTQPNAPAVMTDADSLTYGELDRRADCLAWSLRRRGVGLETRVAACFERSSEWIVALLSILKVGAVYVPLDPAYPRERLAELIEDARVATVLTVSELIPVLPKATRVLLLDGDEPAAETSEDNFARANLRGHNAAYLIYTSGSTGKPKGVEVEHASLVNTVRDQVRRLGVRPQDRVLQFASVSFDASVWEVCTALLAGACVVPIPRAVSVDAEASRRFLVAHGVTVGLLFPSVVQALGVSALTPLRMLCTGGEAAPVLDCQDFARRALCFNLYGPTEAAIAASAHAIDPAASYPFGVPIGRPLANTRLYVLDPSGEPVPVGVPGELYIGGAGVARGYQGQPALTAAAFVPDPFGDVPAGRLYRTGDLVRWNLAGELEFHGRRDRQIKLRGFRIELGEVEAALQRLPEVRMAAAVLHPAGDDPSSQRLVAYFVTADGKKRSGRDLREKLRQALPASLVPDALVELPALPLSASGKVDRTALPAPTFESPEATSEAAPRTDLERVLVGIFARTIRIPPPGIRASFFHLGGNSLLATQAATRIRELLRVEFSVVTLFEAASVEALAAHLLAASPAPEKLEKIASVVLKFENLSPEEKAALLARTRLAVGRTGPSGAD